MLKTQHITNNKTGRWFSNPKPEHLVQFYPYDGALCDTLSEYVASGLSNNETCIVIASRRHVRRLDDILLDAGIDIFAARATGQYVTANAEGAVASFMVDGLPDRNRFSETIETVLSTATQRRQPIRAFGEMVAVLWNEGNQEAMIELENLWNNLAQKYSFALYCAYPEMQFDRTIHDDAIHEITHCHSQIA